MAKEDYVSFETAKLLKEKGFDEPSRFWYDNNGVISQKYIDATDKPLGKDTHYHCVTISFAMKWLREVHCIDIEVRTHYLNYLKPNDVRYYSVKILKGSEDVIHTIYGKDTYEEVCEAAIKYCIENLI